LKSYNSKFLDKHPARYLQLLETQLQVVLHISTPVSARKLTRKQWHCCTSEKTETLHTGSSPHITYRALQKEKNGATMIRQLSAVKVKTVCALRLQCLPNIAGAPLSSSPPDCRCQCSSSRRTLHMGSRPVLSIRSLGEYHSKGFSHRHARLPIQSTKSQMIHLRLNTCAGYAGWLICKLPNPWLQHTAAVLHA